MFLYKVVNPAKTFGLCYATVWHLNSNKIFQLLKTISDNS